MSAKQLYRDRLATVLKIMEMLFHERLRPGEISHRFEISKRTIYRFLRLIEDMGYPIEKDFDSRYFIASDECPFCKQNLIDKKQAA